DAGCVDVDHLRAGPVLHAEDAVARRLRLGRDGGQLLTEELVHERRLADVRPSDDGAEARTHGGADSTNSPAGRADVSVAAWASSRSPAPSPAPRPSRSPAPGSTSPSGSVCTRSSWARAPTAATPTPARACWAPRASRSGWSRSSSAAPR